MINNIKANIQWQRNTTDEYDIIHDNQVLDGAMTIEEANIENGDMIELRWIKPIEVINKKSSDVADSIKQSGFVPVTNRST